MDPAVVDRRPAALRATRLLVAAALAACGGADRGTTPPPGASVVARVAIAPTPPSTLAAGQSLVLTATALTAGGDTVRTATIAWATSADTVVHLVVSGAQATLTAGAAGSAVVSATAGGQRADVALAVTAPAVTGFALTWHQLALPVGQALPLGAAATHADGSTAADPATTYRSTAPGVAGVSPAGAVTGVAPGTALVVAQLGDRADTAVVTVTSGGLAVALDARGLAPGAAVRLGGPTLGAQVAVGGAGAATTPGGTGATFTVPAAPFAPCLAPGQRLPVVVTAGGQTATLLVAAQEAPVVATLAVGQHVVDTVALARGCSVALPTTGTYVAVPFTWDRTDRAYGYQAPPPLAVRVAVDVASATGVSADRSAGPRGLARAGRTARSAQVVAVDGAGRSTATPDLAGPVRAAAYRAAVRRSVAHGAATASAACALPGMGGTVPIYTQRDAAGAYRAIDAAGAPEPWTLVATSATAAVLYDSAMVRVAQADPAIGRRLGQFLAAYDSTVAPLFDRYAGGMPDLDGNGRVIVMVPYFVGDTRGVTPTGEASGGVTPVANTYGRSDCDGNRAEAFLIPSGVFLHADRAVGAGVEVAVHEGTHVIDFSRSRPSAGLYTWWSTEGLAVLVEHLWAAGGTAAGAAAPITSDVVAAPTRTIEGTPWGPLCQLPIRTVLAGVVQGPNGPGYAQACQFTSYVLQRGVAEGVPLADLVQRWMNAQATGGRLTLTQAYNTVLQTGLAPQDVVGPWLLSWVADDRVPGTAPALQDLALHIADPARDLIVAAGQAGALDATLAEPDARFVEVAVGSAGARVRVAAPDGTTLPAGRAALAIVRVR